MNKLNVSNVVVILIFTMLFTMKMGKLTAMNATLWFFVRQNPMNRELIFRAWDKKHKYWTDFDDYPICDLNSYNRLCIEQYTGLTDKNGKKIFENDICTREDGEKGRIIFYANSWCLDMSPFYPLCREGWCEEIIGYPSLEIIGNIHENPELLEVSK